MAKNKKENTSHKTVVETAGDKPVFSPETEKIYKYLLRIMSWVVGLSFSLVIILPVMENVSLDPFTMVVYRIGAVTLIVFTVIEFVSDHIKNQIEKRFHG